MLKLNLLLAFVLCVVATPSFAKDLDVGAEIPAFSAQDQNGAKKDFASLAGEKGLTLVFVRSFEWCPYCQNQTIELSEHNAKFKELGYPVVTVSYDGVDD